VLRVILVDDERLARQRLRQLLAPHGNLQLVGEADGKSSAQKLIEKEQPDAVFLDIQMPGSSGLELLRSLARPPRVVIVTAHPEYATQAFDLEAVDYLLKPVTPQRFAQAVHRLEAACAGKSSGRSQSSYAPEDRICLHEPHHTVVVPVHSIPLLQADGDFTRVFLPDAMPLMICRFLHHFEEVLPQPPFFRTDRSHLINLEAIERLDHETRDRGILKLQHVAEPLLLGRAALTRLRHKLKDSPGS